MKAAKNGFNPEYSEDAPTLEQVSKMQGSAILEFGAPWCSHCQAALSAVQEVLSTQTEIPHIKLYDGKGKPLGRTFKVKQWPTLIFLQDGKELDRLVRPTEVKEVRQFVEQVKSLD